MQRDAWSFAYLLREANKNVFGSHARLRPLTLVSLAAFMSLSIFAASEAHRFSSQLDSLDARGRNVILLSASDPASTAEISRRSCEYLSTVAGVERAGLLAPSGHADFLRLGRNIPIIFASASLFPNLGPYEALIGASLISSTRPTVLLTSSGKHLHAAGGQVAPDSLGVGSAVTLALEPSINQGAQCVVILSKFSDAQKSIPMLAGQLEVSGAPISGRQQLTETVDVVSAYIHRPGLYLPLILGVMGAILSALVNGGRASELAAYFLSGSSRRSMFILVALEQLLVAGIGFSSGIFALIVLSQYFFHLASVIFGLAAGAFGWVGLSCLMSLPVILKKPTELAKDR